jgi:hypothetical protein
MSRKEDNFVPLPEAQDNRTRTMVHLPAYVDSEGILINLSGINRLSNLGGIRHVDIRSLADNETSRSMPTIAGWTPDGKALGGRIATKVVTEYTSRSVLVKTTPYRPHAEQQIDTAIEINTAEINQRIQNDRKIKQGVRNQKAWSKHLNKDIKDSITKEGMKHLVAGLDTYNRFMAITENGLMFSSGLAYGFESKYLPAWIFATSGFLNFIFFMASDVKHDYRFSLLYGPQVDRAIVLYLASLGTTIVKNQT